MNEGLYVYLDFDRIPMEEQEKVVERVDEILRQHRVHYTGFQNLYVPDEKTTRDQDIFEGQAALRRDEILKDGIRCLPVATMTNVCPLDKIQIQKMSEPDSRKYRRYEKYYQRTGRLAHPIVVDENGVLRDGYISYLLAKTYKLRELQISVEEAFSNQPLYKVVLGRHVEPEQDGKGYRVTCENRYAWIYELKRAVVPGDILEVDTRKGRQLMRVDLVEMRTGECWVSGMRKVRRHL